MQQPRMSRPVELLLELCAIPSPPGEERAVADRVTRELDAIGLAWDEDDAGPSIGSTTGNILCRLPGRDGRRHAALPLRPSRHRPADGELEPVVEDGVVRNAGGTILGADNKSAVVVMLEAARRIVAEGRPARGRRAPLHAEGGGRARRRRRVRRGRLEARLGYVYDQAAPIGEIILGAPSAQELAAHVPRTRRARGDVPRGGTLGDRRGRARDRRHAARPDRRGDDRQRRRDPRRHGAQHRPRVVLVRGRGALARPRAGHARSSRRCSTPPRSPRASRTARSRPRSSRSTRATGSATTTSPSGSPPRR